MVVDAAGGSLGLQDLGPLESAVAQPQATLEGCPLYPDVNSMAAALGYSIVANHPFIDGNKRAGHAAVETCLWLNGGELDAPLDEQEAVMLAVAAGSLDREGLAAWLATRVSPRQQS